MISPRWNGSLFTHDYLWIAIRDEPEYQNVALQTLAAQLKSVFDDFPTDQSPNETQTEDELIWKVLNILGWEDWLRQINLSPKGRDIPDGVLFLDRQSKSTADRQSEGWKRYQHGAVLVESKRWKLSLDRGGGGGISHGSVYPDASLSSTRGRRYRGARSLGYLDQR